MLKKPFLKFLIKFLLLISLLFILDIFLGVIFNKLLQKQSDGRFFKILYSLDKSNEDIIILGSSRAETNYNPLVFSNKLGMSCWNTGRGGQTIPYFNIIEQEILKRYTPKIFILNMDPTGLEEPIDFDRASILKPFAKDHKTIYEFFKRKNGLEKYKLMSNIYLYNSMMFYFIRPYILKNKDGQLQEKGWKPRRGEILQSVIPQYNEAINFDSINVDERNLNKDKIDYLNQIIDDTKRKNVKLIISFSPDFLPINKETATKYYIKKLGRQKNFSVFDFTRDTTLVRKKEYFYDREHMNNIGADVYSKLISEKLIQILKKDTLK